MKADKVSVSRAVKEKTYYDLKAYCKLRGLSYRSLVNGYVSKASARVLKKDGIDLGRLKVVA